MGLWLEGAVLIVDEAHNLVSVMMMLSWQPAFTCLEVRQAMRFWLEGAMRIMVEAHKLVSEMLMLCWRPTLACSCRKRAKLWGSGWKAQRCVVLQARAIVRFLFLFSPSGDFSPFSIS
eukprot:scaffold306972_cov19-Tisochrysis_lutea.AAC.1